ncbi:unnamed protein product [Symbiodinium sp. CCMP2592]|nr:unnamed protein product [Symbiodinium sp. CCMP2592]
MQARIELLEEQVFELRALLGVEEGGFEIVRTPRPVSVQGSPEPRSAGRARSSQAAASSRADTHCSSAARNHGEGVPPLPRTDRDSACREIGLWLLRSLSGEHRGASGHEGNLLQPVRVYTSYHEKGRSAAQPDYLLVGQDGPDYDYVVGVLSFASGPEGAASTCEVPPCARLGLRRRMAPFGAMPFWLVACLPTGLGDGRSWILGIAVVLQPPNVSFRMPLVIGSFRSIYDPNFGCS